MKLATTITVLCTSIAAAPMAIADHHGEKHADMEARVAALEATLPGANNTRFSMGGYIKFDANYSQYSTGAKSATAPIGNDFYVPSTVPVGSNQSGGSGVFNTTAKQSRLWFKAVTPTSRGDVSAHVELDFQTNGAGLTDERIINGDGARIRHAFLTWDKWLFGQTWSTFFNVSALPETLDFVGAAGTVFNRQAQVRYTRGPLMVSVENPSTTLYGNAQVMAPASYDQNDVPDVVVRYNHADSWGNVSLAALGRQLKYEDGNFSDEEYGYGLSLAGVLNVGDRNDVRMQLNYGNALGRYTTLNAFRAGQIEADGSIDLIDQYSAVLAYRHHLTERVRSNLVLSVSEADNPDTVAGTTNKRVQSAHVNTIWQIAAPLIVGAEFIYGHRETEAGETGNVKRVQFTARYVF